MHVVILAAGFSTRMGVLGRTPKPLLPLGRGCILDYVVTSMWVPGVTAIHVVHNNQVWEWQEPDGNGIPRRKQCDWSKAFKTWRSGLRWEPEPGNREPPYIKLHNNGVSCVDGRKGAVGDLSWIVKKMNPDKIEDGIVVTVADNLQPNIPLDSLTGANLPRTGPTDSAVVCRHVDDVHVSVLKSLPSCVRLTGGLVTEIGSVECNGEPWLSCGPMFLSKRDIPFLFDWVEYHNRAEVLPDSLGRFWNGLCEDQDVRAVCLRDGGRFRDCGTVEGYEYAKSLYSGEAAARYSLEALKTPVGVNEAIKSGFLKRQGS